MQNFKAEIAEALFDSSVKVSKDALLWAMSNLPDHRNHGDYGKSGSVVKHDYNHEAQNIWEAVGLNKQQVDELGAIIVDKLKLINEPNSTVSKVVEGIIDATIEHPNLILLIAVKVVQDALEMAESASQMTDIAKMMKMMKMLSKFKKDDDES
jgi:hypothetical protein